MGRLWQKVNEKGEGGNSRLPGHEQRQRGEETQHMYPLFISRTKLHEEPREINWKARPSCVFL